MARSDAVRLSALLALLFWVFLATAEEFQIREEEGEVFLEPRQNYQFTGALAIYGSDGSSYSGSSNGGQQSGSTAVPAQCPSDHPQSCSSIGESGYCCPSNNYCAWHNSAVSCCPNGATCSGGGSSYQTTQVGAAGAPATTVYNNPSPTSYVGGYGGYCSTLVAVGPGLPTTEAGQCGTILIVEADAIQNAVLNWTRWGLMVLGLHVLGGFILLRR